MTWDTRVLRCARTLVTERRPRCGLVWRSLAAFASWLGNCKTIPYGGGNGLEVGVDVTKQSYHEGRKATAAWCKKTMRPLFIRIKNSNYWGKVKSTFCTPYP